MIWNSASEFWAMGGYGLYVWGSFGVTALLMGGEVILAARRHQHTRESLQMQVTTIDSDQDTAKDWQP
ncbi:heme exporter protein CcmD [Limnohabitans sp. Rim8]|jgi:heme exporter protein D|uniref:heme exporter protein CcmD n=1 Tax=Limnohabitans sp. Rim8 TaxID=1100718 RepID=UPI002607AE87|nr:heme exporter protein CcmD [Limnohabitans sp. Rim8]